MAQETSSTDKLPATEQQPSADTPSAAELEFPLARLVELATKYPEIGPPLAELAFRIGQPSFAERVMRMGLDRGVRGLEYYFVAANMARHEGRAADVLRLAIDAVRVFAAAVDTELAEDDASRLLHLVRLGFATLLFDVKDARGDSDFVRDLGTDLPRLEARLGADPFYRSLMAQTLWYEDQGRSEEEWERAVALGDGELAWNARGTWYKDAARDLARSEAAYRKGLAKAPASALLSHNLAQVLLERCEQSEDVEAKRKLLRETDDLLRAALRGDAPKGLRRHIHATRDRLQAVRSQVPARRAAETEEQRANTPSEPERLPEPGEVLRGRVVSLTDYGAFVSLPGRGVGLLHKSELAHGAAAGASTPPKIGDELEVKVLDVRVQQGARARISLSQKALLPSSPEGEGERPAGGPTMREGENGGGSHRRGRGGRGRRGAPSPDAARGRDERSGQGRDTDPRRSQGRGDELTRPRHIDETRRGGRELEAKLASLGEVLLAKMNKGTGPKGNA